MYNIPNQHGIKPSYKKKKKISMVLRSMQYHPVIEEQLPTAACSLALSY